GGLARRADRRRDDADIACDLRRLWIVEISRPAWPIEVDCDGARGKTSTKLIPEVIGVAGRHSLGLVEIDEPVERTHACFGIESRLTVLVEIFTAFSDQHFIEAAIDGFFLARKLRAVEIRRIREEYSLI